MKGLTVTPTQKKTAVKFLVGGLAAVLINKAGEFINKKADEQWPDEEDTAALPE
jgi:hypothetical protein